MIAVLTEEGGIKVMSGGFVPTNEYELQQMIDSGQEESLYLDYKRSKSLAKTDLSKNELSKDVSAFANSEGGVLVYGVTETRTQNEPPKPREIDEGIDPSDISKEWIENVINSRIQRRISNVRIHDIPLGGTKKGRIVYIVSVPQSYDAPHQAHDRKYYKRFNFQSIPMEDYEIRDVRNRRFEPSIVAVVSGRSKSRGTAVEEITLSIVLRNCGKRMAYQVYLQCDIPSRYINSQVTRAPFENFIREINGLQYRRLTYYHRDQSGALPLFPNTECEIMDGNRMFIHLRMDLEDYNQVASETFVFWEVYADGAEPNIQKISLQDLFDSI